MEFTTIDLECLERKQDIVFVAVMSNLLLTACIAGWALFELYW